MEKISLAIILITQLVATQRCDFIVSSQSWDLIGTTILIWGGALCIALYLLHRGVAIEKAKGLDSSSALTLGYVFAMLPIVGWSLWLYLLKTIATIHISIL